MADDDIIQESEYLKKSQAKLIGEQTLLTVYQHPFGLIIIYLITFTGLIGAFILLSLLLKSVGQCEYIVKN